MHRLYPGRYEVACGRASLETPLLDISTCVRMKQAVSYLLQHSCPDGLKLALASTVRI